MIRSLPRKPSNSGLAHCSQLGRIKEREDDGIECDADLAAGHESMLEGAEYLWWDRQSDIPDAYGIPSEVGGQGPRKEGTKGRMSRKGVS